MIVREIQGVNVKSTDLERRRVLSVVKAYIYCCVKRNEAAKSQVRHSVEEAAKQKALALARDTCGELCKVKTRVFPPRTMDLVLSIVVSDRLTRLPVAYFC